MATSWHSSRTRWEFKPEYLAHDDDDDQDDYQHDGDDEDDDDDDDEFDNEYDDDVDVDATDDCYPALSTAAMFPHCLQLPPPPQKPHQCPFPK